MKTRWTKSLPSVSEKMSERSLKVLNIHTFVEVTILITGYFTSLDFNFVIHNNIKFKDPSISNIYAYSPKLHYPQSYTNGILKAYLQNKYFQSKKYNCAAFINVTEVDKTKFPILVMVSILFLTMTFVAWAGFHCTSITPPHSIKTEIHCTLLSARFNIKTVHKAVQGIFNWQVTQKQNNELMNLTLISDTTISDIINRIIEKNI